MPSFTTRRVVLGATLLALLACASELTNAGDGGDGGNGVGSGGSVPQDSVPGDSIPGGGTDSIPGGRPDSIPTVTPLQVQVAVCTPQPVKETGAVIGPKGGKLKIGRYELDVPRRALADTVTITMRTLPDSVSGVEFAPHGLRFAAGADVRLRLDYDSCPAARRSGKPKRVAYIDDQRRVLEVNASQDDVIFAETDGQLAHFSKYAVAY